jgi:hypothetical protein
MRIPLSMIAAFSLLIACGDDGSGPGGGIDAPECMPGEVHVVGSLGDLPIDETISIDGHAFVNAIGESNGYFEGYFLGSPALRLEFPDLLPDGENGPAAGMVDFSSFGGLAAGNCLPATAFPGEIHIPASDTEPGAFILRDLHESPACTGPEIAGELRGCWIEPPD